MSGHSLLVTWRNAVRDSALDSTAKLTAYTLSTYMSRDGLAWPAKTTLADKASLSVRAVDGAITRLERGGFLLVERSGYRRGGNRYRATLPNQALAAHLGFAKPASDDLQTGISCAPIAQQLRTKAFESKEKARPSIKEDPPLPPSDGNCFICGDNYLIPFQLGNLKGPRPALIGYAGQWWCQEHHDEERGLAGVRSA
jgi:hypothetical protein